MADIDVKGRQLLDDHIKQRILSMKSDQITVTEINELFATRFDMKTKTKKPPMIPRNTYIRLHAGEYINKKDILTTPGLLIFNKIFTEGAFEAIVPDGYYNEELNNKGLFKYMGFVSDALASGKIGQLEHVVPFIKKFEVYGFMQMGGLCSSFTPDTAKSDKELMQLKAKLLAELPENPTLQQIVDVEDALVAAAREKFKNDPGMRLYDSGARGSFANDFKMNNLMVGPVKNPLTGDYDFMTNNLSDGIDKKDIPIMANTVVNGSYPKAVGTADAGYKTKMFYMGFQTLRVGAKGSDCGTNKTIQVKITSKNANDYIDSYIVENGKLVVLTRDNIKGYIGKVVHKRTPLYCISDDICNVCAGNRYHNIGVTEIGATSVALPNGLMNKGMKAFHDTKVKFHTVDLDKLIQ